MNRKINSQVSPKTTAVVILTVLVVIQIVWWRGLIVTMHVRGGAGGSPRGGPRPQAPLLIGRKDVRVETLTGGLEPDDADGPGRNARFDSPVQLAVDSRGNLYVADSRNHRIRQVAPNGKTTTLAGSSAGYADGPAAAAQFNLPCGVAVGPDGSVYVADTGNHRIRRIKDGQVTTLAGSSAGMADGQGVAARFNLPVAIAYGKGFQGSDGLTLADAGNHRVRALDLSGKTLAEWKTVGTPVGIVTGQWAAVAAANILSLNLPPKWTGVPNGLWKALHDVPIDMQSLSGNQADYTLQHPVALCPAPGGWFVTDAEQSAVFHVHDGKADLIAGRSQGRTRHAGWKDGDGEAALFGRLGGLVTDGQGHLYVCDTSNNMIRRITLPQDLVTMQALGVRR